MRMLTGSVALRSSVVLTLLALVGGGAACSPKAASVEVQPKDPRLTMAQRELLLQATVRDDKGAVLDGVPVTFASLTPTVATADSQGRVRAVKSGQATVLVTAGKVKHELTVIVQLAKKLVIEPESPRLNLGVTRGFKGTVYNDEEEPMLAGEIRWTSSDPTVASVDKHGNVKTLKEGETTLTAHAAGITGKTVLTVKHEHYNEKEGAWE